MQAKAPKEEAKAPEEEEFKEPPLILLGANATLTIILVVSGVMVELTNSLVSDAILGAAEPNPHRMR